MIQCYIMKCELCNRDNLSARELAVHRKYFHTETPRDAIQQPGVAAAIITTNKACPDCGGQLIYEEGCEHCVGCGYSKCG